MQHRSYKENLVLNAMQMDDLTVIGDVLNIPLAKLIEFSENFCVYSSSAHNIMVNWVHPFFGKLKLLLSRRIMKISDSP